MPVYAYECSPCGPFELVRAMAAVDLPAACPACGTAGRRVFGAPALRTLDPAMRRALDAAHRSSDAPAVVSGPPPRRRPRQRPATDPRQARLPRP